MPWRPRARRDRFEISAEHGPKPLAIDGFQQGSQSAAELLLALARASLPRPDSPSDEGAVGVKSGELLTLLLTPGDFGANKPGLSKGLRASDRKSSKQPVLCSNHPGGVLKKQAIAKVLALEGLVRDL
jgi:hypothetical protein